MKNHNRYKRSRALRQQSALIRRLTDVKVYDLADMHAMRSMFANKFRNGGGHAVDVTKKLKHAKDDLTNLINKGIKVPA